MSHASNRHNAALIFESAELGYDFGPQHPLHAQRLQACIELLEASDLWHPDCAQTRLRAGQPASFETLRLIHSADYISAVQHLSMTTPALDEQQLLQLEASYGLGPGDTLVFPGMHEVASIIVGGTVTALEAVMGAAQEEDKRDGMQPLHVFHPAGGWHHAQVDQASGFCVYNDIAIAIAHILRTREAKVAYIDFDAHHGDGVQNAFYDDPRVLTISFHETGRYLFPGTGELMELGSGSGRGYTVNVPLEPFTEDDSYIEVMQMLLAPLLTSFGPDILISMHGCDTHAWDPLTHLSLSMRGIKAQAQLAHELAHTYCAGRWVAVGGGGYDLYRVVPRAWSIVWAEMAQLPLPPRLPPSWVKQWYPVWVADQRSEDAAAISAPEEELPQRRFPTTFEDARDAIPVQPRHDAIGWQNRLVATMARRLLLPLAIRHAFPLPARKPPSPLTGLFDLLHPDKGETPSRSRVISTPRGKVILRDFCPTSLVERLHVDTGMRAFARFPEREHQLLLSIARNPDCALALAHTPEGAIIGQVTLAPLDNWWSKLENAYEIAIEVSEHWRGLGIARRLLEFALELETLEDLILCALGLSWHWDIEGLHSTPHRYREMLIHLFASQGFTEFATTEPDIMMDPVNVLLVRVGGWVDPREVEEFRQVIQRTPSALV